MLPTSNEKAKSKEQDSYIKKKTFSLLNNNNCHTRSQSSSSSSTSSAIHNNEPATIQSSFNLENNKRGWLEPTSVQVNPSRSLDRKLMNNSKSTSTVATTASTSAIRKPLIKDISQKDILGAVSDEDIFKLTELTSRLPEVTTSSSTKQKHYHSRHRSEHDENITRKRNHSTHHTSTIMDNNQQQQSPDGIEEENNNNNDQVTPSDKMITSHQITKPGIRRPSFSTPSSTTTSPISTRNSSEIMLDTPENINSETKRRSWLYKSLIKPYKNKSKSSSAKSSLSSTDYHNEEDPSVLQPIKSAAASIADDFYNNRTSLDNDDNSSNASSSKNQSNENLSSLPITRDTSNNNSNNKKLIPSLGLSRIHSINVATSSDVLKNKLKSAKRFSNNSPLHARSSSHVTGEASTSSNNMNRRHSFDSFQSLMKEADEVNDRFLHNQQDAEDEDIMNLIDSKEFIEQQDKALAKWDEERKKEREKPTFGYSHEERPNFHLVVSSDNIHENNNNNDTHDQLTDNDDQVLSEVKKVNTGTNTPAIVVDNLLSSADQLYKEKLVTFMFDYYSLPVEVKSLIDAYEHKGEVERKKMIVKYKRKDIGDIDEDDDDMIKEEDEDENEEDDNDDEDDDDEEEESEDNTVDYRDLITGNCSEGKSSSQKDTRDIAVVTTTKSDNIEFTKLIQIAMEGPSDNGPLLDLHISLFGENNYESDINVRQEEFQDTIQSVEKSLERFQSFRKESAAFLRDHMNTMETLNLYSHQEYDDDHIPNLSRTYSYPTLHSNSYPNNMSERPAIESQFSEEPEPISSSGSSMSSSASSDGSTAGVILRPVRDILAHKESYNRNAHSMYVSNTEYKTRDPFDRRQKEIVSLVNSLKAELHKFKDSLEKTEDLVNDVQVDMDDTRNRMETYIKDIPESHYSALKKLEVDIESILSKRAKNPWLDTGYALLSYLLTMFALVVWIVIYVLKWGKKIILFPRQLWRAYSDYLVERNKVVKKASMRSLAGGSNRSNSLLNMENSGQNSPSSTTTRILDDDNSLFQRSNRVTRREE